MEKNFVKRNRVAYAIALAAMFGAYFFWPRAFEPLWLGFVSICLLAVAAGIFDYLDNK